ncbi:N-dimethylarginine dimethylaminohydrolase [Allocatelliglobosispora scoriae]|uniref:N-dimethylarginine dimethylaminohydrolase n=1 Tax=Allocatelliglobosispora scoriae TaxID=643052 RepID=A0A841BTB7_9ACTN|nr:arginine deiminase family protein [Allocatelliglobosispora scoriae]MBB5870163.1 N-dimethylarginine dimethylaminohydrolase [Allocatelliglobosispora scoriae]
MTYGVRSSVAPLRRAALRRPAVTGDWAEAGWRRPDTELLLAQHEAFAEKLTELGVSVEVAPATEGEVDAVFAYDSVFVIGGGTVVFRSAKPCRQGEAAKLAAALEGFGVPTMASLTAPSVMDGGDVCWIGDNVAVAGRGYRTNQAAHEELRALLAAEGQQLFSYDMPHDQGPAHVLHLMSGISPVADDLAVVFEPIMPVALLQELAAREITTIPVDPDEYATLGSNVLAVHPGVVVIFEGNPKTAAALAKHGVEVHEVAASELAKGDGGPTCLTRPLWRA